MHGSCGVTKLRSLHQAPLTTPHYSAIRVCAGIASAHSGNSVHYSLQVSPSSAHSTNPAKLPAPLTPPSSAHFASLPTPVRTHTASLMPRCVLRPATNSNFSLREKTGTPSASPSRLRLLSLRSPAEIYALEFGERLPSQPNLPFSSGHHPPPLRSPDDRGSKGRP